MISVLKALCSSLEIRCLSEICQREVAQANFGLTGKRGFVVLLKGLEMNLCTEFIRKQETQLFVSCIKTFSCLLTICPLTQTNRIHVHPEKDNATETNGRTAENQSSQSLKILRKKRNTHTVSGHTCVLNGGELNTQCLGLINTVNSAL